MQLLLSRTIRLSLPTCRSSSTAGQRLSMTMSPSASAGGWALLLSEALSPAGGAAINTAATRCRLYTDSSSRWTATGPLLALHTTHNAEMLNVANGATRVLQCCRPHGKQLPWLSTCSFCKLSLQRLFLIVCLCSNEARHSNAPCHCKSGSPDQQPPLCHCRQWLRHEQRASGCRVARMQPKSSGLLQHRLLLGP